MRIQLSSSLDLGGWKASKKPNLVKVIERNPSHIVDRNLALAFAGARSGESARENICSALAFRKSLEKARLSINKFFGCIYVNKSSVKLAFSTPKVNDCNENSPSAFGRSGLLNENVGPFRSRGGPSIGFKSGHSPN